MLGVKGNLEAGWPLLVVCGGCCVLRAPELQTITTILMPAPPASPVPEAPASPRRAEGSFPRAVLFPVFVISGISALIYQMVWQRMLLMIYGSNSESVAMVVA